MVYCKIVSKIAQNHPKNPKCFTYVSLNRYKKPHKCLIVCNLWGYPCDSYRCQTITFPCIGEKWKMPFQCAELGFLSNCKGNKKY